MRRNPVKKIFVALIMGATCSAPLYADKAALTAMLGVAAPVAIDDVMADTLITAVAVKPQSLQLPRDGTGRYRICCPVIDSGNTAWICMRLVCTTQLTAVAATVCMTAS